MNYDREKYREMLLDATESVQVILALIGLFTKILEIEKGMV
jgi:hypothetical protein